MKHSLIAIATLCSVSSVVLAETNTTAPTDTTTAASTSPKTTSESGTTEKPKEEAKPSGQQGLLGPISVGPAITVVGFPTLFRGGLEVRALSLFGAAVDYGMFPQVPFNNMTFALASLRFSGRIFPFSGSFFLGVSYSLQSFVGTRTETILTESVKMTLTINTAIVTPHIGWRWGNPSGGFFTGMELGVQLPLSTSSTFTPNDVPGTDAFEADMNAQAQTFGQTMLPWVAMVQFGFMI